MPDDVPLVMNIPFPPPLDLSGNVAANWKKFRRTWDNYEIASRLNQQSTEQRAATLLTCIGPEALDLVDGLPFENDGQIIFFPREIL